MYKFSSEHPHMHTNWCGVSVRTVVVTRELSVKSVYIPTVTYGNKQKE